ncbi:hypothetical protein CHLRE_06g299100v5 [Chlamydomonas reinhardtii]|uniref:Uncharacterized protein n=1 Tax=Chlamydomonas reinhardtii TaxID=3055 RepID=A0A2K3DR00_CHLRE|nr:uncharacterized protein CHLRE_06g299100v5 [Chlamydomonas reinhardtii]PNW82908.1 hypothetical protein CHLRE_06g299100v5 [Chlamydomonas reinhardtii]
MPSQYSKLQANKFDAWKHAYMHLGSRAVTLNDLRLQGTSACILQLIVTTVLPVVWYLIFYNKDSRLTPVPILTWSITALAACLGISGFVFLKSLLLGLHAVLALALSAALGVFHTELYMLLVDRCERTQLSFRGCSTCACAAANNCTRAALATGACVGCKAWSTEVCSGVDTAASALPYMGVIELLFIALPAVWSFMVLMRMEKEHNDAANKLLYARSVVNRELDRLEAKRGLDVDLMVFKQLLTTMQRLGTARDRAAVSSACELLGLDAELLAVEFDEEAGGRYGSATAGGGHHVGPSYKVGSVTTRHEDYLKHMAAQGGGGFLNSSVTLPAPPGTPQGIAAHAMPHAPPLSMAAHDLQADRTRARAELPHDPNSPGPSGYRETPVEQWDEDPEHGQYADDTDYYDESSYEHGEYPEGSEWVTDYEDGPAAIAAAGGLAAGGAAGAAAAGGGAAEGEAAPKKKKKKKKKSEAGAEGEAADGTVKKKKKKKRASVEGGPEGGAAGAAASPGADADAGGEAAAGTKKKKKGTKKGTKKNAVVPTDAADAGLPGGVMNDMDLGLVDAALEELEMGVAKEKKAKKKAGTGGKKARKSDA